MTSTTFFFFFIPLLASLLLLVNLFFAPHNPYQEKDSPFECGYHSFLGQNRTQFNISFFVFALLFLLFDLEILLAYPYVVSAYLNSILGLIIVEIFFFVLTTGLVYELGKGVLKIPSKQNKLIEYSDSSYNSNYNYNYTSINNNQKLMFSLLNKPGSRFIHTGNTPPQDRDWDSDEEQNWDTVNEFLKDKKPVSDSSDSGGSDESSVSYSEDSTTASSLIRRFENSENKESELNDYVEGKKDYVNNKAQDATDACANLHNSNIINDNKHEMYQELIDQKKDEKIAALNERRDVVQERLDDSIDNDQTTDNIGRDDIASLDNKRTRDTDSSDSEDNMESKRVRNDNNQSTIDYVIEQESTEMSSIYDLDGGD